MLAWTDADELAAHARLMVDYQPHLRGVARKQTSTCARSTAVEFRGRQKLSALQSLEGTSFTALKSEQLARRLGHCIPVAGDVRQGPDSQGAEALLQLVSRSSPEVVCVSLMRRCHRGTLHAHALSLRTWAACAMSQATGNVSEDEVTALDMDIVVEAAADDLQEDSMMDLDIGKYGVSQASGSRYRSEGREGRSPPVMADANFFSPEDDFDESDMQPQ